MKIKDIRALSGEELENKLNELKDKLFKQRMQKAMGHAAQPHQIRGTRKDIARILTIMSENERS